MKLLFLLEELEEVDKFKDFIKKYDDTYLAAGFFVLDNESKDKAQLDYFIPSLKKIATIAWPFESNDMKIQEDDIKFSEKLNKNLKIDVCDLRIRVDELCKEKNVNFKVSKIIAILKDDKWDLTCLSFTLDIVKIKLNSITGELLKFDKASFMDFMSIKKK